MKARRFCLSAALAVVVTHLHATGLSATDRPFPTALARPEVAGSSFAEIVVWLGVGAALGWSLLSVCVGLLLRQERKLQ